MNSCFMKMCQDIIAQRDGNGEERIAQGDGVPEEVSRHWQRVPLLDFDAGISLLKSRHLSILITCSPRYFAHYATTSYFKEGIDCGKVLLAGLLEIHAG